MAHVLLVDDNMSVRTLFHVILENEGHRVTHASDGAEALDHYDRLDIDLVITDLLMPGMGGTEFILELKKKNPDIPIIAVSGGDPDPDDTELDIILTSSSVRHLKKPFKPDRLIQTMKEIYPGL